MRKTLTQIKHNPSPEELYKTLMASPGWAYKTVSKREHFLARDRCLCATLYLGDFRISEALPLTTENFEDKGKYLWVKDVVVGKKRHGKIEYREAKFPYAGERKVFTELVEAYLQRLKDGQRLFPWSLKKIRTPIVNHPYITKDKVEHTRYSVQTIGTKRAWQIVNAMLPDYTQHWLRAFGYNYDYDNMDHDVMAVSDKTKADPRSLQPYLRRRYEKYPVR